MKKYLRIFVFLFITISFLTSAKPCLAASAKVDITSENTQVTVGDTVYAYIKISSQTTFGDFEANLTYDKDILKFKGGASVITGGNGYLKISDMNKDGTDNTRKYALEFEAVKKGECEIAFDDKVMVYDESELELPVSSNSLTINVKPKKTASTDTCLKTLETDPEGLIPDFKKNVFDYTIHVGSELKRLIITAIPEDDKSKVTITGNDSLQDGENKIVITVLAESGDVIEYTINAIRETAPTVTVQPTVTPEITQNKFDIIQSEGETYFVYSTRYKLVEPGSDIVIPEGYTKAELTISGFTVNIYTPDYDPKSDFVLIYAENESGEAGFYQYDKVENTLQRYTQAPVGTDQSRLALNRAAIIIAILSAFSLLMAIAVIFLFIKLRHRRKDD